MEARTPNATPLQISMAVIGALIVRDMKTRAGTSFLGYFIMAGVPLGHLGILVIIYEVLDKVVPYGTDRILYFSLSILPFVIFLYPSRQIMISLTSNRTLMEFPRVKTMDIAIARGLLECVTATVVSCIVLAVVLISGSTFSPRDTFGIIEAILATMYFGFALGYVNALIAQIFPFWVYAFALMAPLFWVTSGIIFLPIAVPEPYQSWLLMNPLLCCCEWIRYSYYEGYLTPVKDLQFVFWTSTAVIAASFLAERIYRRQLLS